MSKTRSKNILGIFSVLIMLHHLGQRTSAFWVPANVRQHGLEVFVPIGYLLVSFFFFCSGYGLIKSMRTKEDYFKGFLIKRLNRILFIFVVTEIIYLVIRIMKDAAGLPINPYSWFIYTIIILYIGFYLIYRKDRKSAFLLMAAWVLIYSIICYVLVLGNWWFNASPVFLLGIYMADHEPSLEDKKKRLIMLIIPAVIFLAAFPVSEKIDYFFRLLNLQDYGVANMVRVILQIAACSAFSFIIYIAARLIPEIKNSAIQKVLGFFGGMTLEFYLIHGLYVQIFGHHFMTDSKPPVCYIRNVFLYVLVVFVLAAASAFVIKKAYDITAIFYEKSEMFRKFCRDQKKTALVVSIIVVVFTVFYSLHRHQLSKDSVKVAEKYKKEFITSVNVNGAEVATYTAGEGEYTLVLLGSDWNPCPTLYLRPLADKLSDKYRVVIIDYPGKGYSSDSDKDRTTAFFTDTIHETLSALGVSENIILVPNELSGIYAYDYIEKYPEGVVGLAGVTAVVPGIAPHFLDGNYSSVNEYRWYMKRVTRLEWLQQKFLTATGYVRLQLPMFDYMFYGSGLKEYYPVMEDMFVKNYMQPTHLKELEIVYDNCMTVNDFKLPSDLPTIFILDNYVKSTDIYGMKWSSEYKKMITNEDIQSVKIVSGDPYTIYYNPSAVAKMLDDFIAASYQ